MLSELLGISRITARKAIDALVSDGLVVRRHGSGNFIAPRLEQPLTRLSTFTEELKQRGFQPRSQWLRRFIGTAQAEEIIALGLPPGRAMAIGIDEARVSRLRYGNGQFEVRYINTTRFERD